MELLTSFWEIFCKCVDWLKTDTGKIVGVLFSSSVLLFVANAFKSYRLLRLYHAGELRGRNSTVILELLSIWREKPITIFRQRSLFTRTRMRLEYEVLKKRPRDRAELRKYNDERKATLGSRGMGAISLETAHDLHKRFDQINLYFRNLLDVGHAQADLRFATSIDIADGFIAPLHLVAGLLREFDEDWAQILRIYAADRAVGSRHSVSDPIRHTLEELREIQQFIFLCWLQWGPSIPICDCKEYQGSWTSLQYGYGDENNSIEIVGETSRLKTMWSELKLPHATRRDGHEVYGRAINARVTGHLALSRHLPSQIGDKVGNTLRTSWRSDDAEGGRIILLVSRINFQSVDATGAPSTFTVEDSGQALGTNSRIYYYSAYLWAIFVTVVPGPHGEFSPVHQDPGDFRRSAEPWLDFIPFFEHGNVADPETYDFLKRQLAEKVVAGFRKLVCGTARDAIERERRARAYPLRFAYACSVDHSGCDTTLRFETGAFRRRESGFPAGSIPDLIHAEITANHPELAPLILFTYYNQGHCPHASCHLPRDIESYLNHMRARTAAGQQAPG